MHQLAIAAILVSGPAMAQNTEPASPVPAHKAVHPAAVELGRKLFFDPRRSKSN